MNIPPLKIPPPTPPITDDRDFMLRIDDTILRAARCLKDLHSQKISPNDGGSMREWKLILNYMLDHRQAVMSNKVPPLRERQMKVIGRMFIDSWNHEDIDGPWAYHTLGYYVKHDQITFDAEHYSKHTTPEAQAAIADAPNLLALEQPNYAFGVPNIPLEPRMREMPHKPHRRSLMMPRDAAIAFVQQSPAKRASAVERRDIDFLRTFASQHLIIAFTDHWLSEPAASTRGHLRAAAQAQREALVLGWRPNAWEIFDCLHLGIVCAMPELTEGLATAAAGAFTDERIRPIDFLSWLTLSVLDLQRQDDQNLLTHMHNLHEALFNSKQPSELDVELPLWKASFEVLHALRHRQTDSINRSLAQRESERVRHYLRGGSSAPIALIDLHGLAWCALARRRGLAVTIEHIYLPLAVLDPITGETPTAG